MVWYLNGLQSAHKNLARIGKLLAFDAERRVLQPQVPARARNGTAHCAFEHFRRLLELPQFDLERCIQPPDLCHHRRTALLLQHDLNPLGNGVIYGFPRFTDFFIL